MVLHLPATKLGAATARDKQDREELRWSRPREGWAQLKTDGSFIQETGAAGGGMVLRGDTSTIIYTACKEIRTCDNALDRTLLSFVVEMDCTEAVMMIKSPTRDRSMFIADNPQV